MSLCLEIAAAQLSASLQKIDAFVRVYFYEKVYPYYRYNDYPCGCRMCNRVAEPLI